MWSVSISVSPCEDAARIGYDGRQINRIVIRIAQYFLDQNMRVIFGHDWREDGVMRAVADFAEVVAARAGSVKKRSDGWKRVYSGRDPKPRMLNVVPTEKESLSRTALEACRDSGGVLDVIPFRDEFGHLSELLPHAMDLSDNLEGRFGWGAELTAFRYVITKLLAPGCRICLGGKTTGYEGAKPGVMEEAALALECGKPLYLMGGFGGATRTFGKNSDNIGIQKTGLMRTKKWNYSRRRT